MTENKNEQANYNHAQLSSKQIITTLHKDWSKMKLGNLGSKNIDHFIVLLEIFQEEQHKTGSVVAGTLTIPFKEIQKRALVEKNGALIPAAVNRKQFINKLKDLCRDLIGIYEEYETTNSISFNTLFNTFEIDLENDCLKIRWSESALPLIEHLSSNAIFISRELFFMKSQYAKILFILMKEYDNKLTTAYKDSGRCEYIISIDDFYARLGVPQSYKSSQLWQKVINPCLTELETAFPQITCESHKSAKENNRVTSLKFSWIPADKIAQPTTTSVTVYDAPVRTTSANNNHAKVASNYTVQKSKYGFSGERHYDQSFYDDIIKKKMAM